MVRFRRVISWFAAVSMVVGVAASPVGAICALDTGCGSSTSSVSAAPTKQTDPLLAGQVQTYSATMRTDKRVVTTAKIIFTNPENTDKKSFSFTLPDGVTVSNMSIYQVLPPKKAKGCTTYETLQEYRTRAYESSSVPDTDTSLLGRYNDSRRCIVPLSTEYDEDYDFRSGYLSAASDYGIKSADQSSVAFQKIIPSVTGATHTLSLAHPVKSQKDGAIILSYVGSGFVSELGGVYTYDYQTLKVSDTISTVTVNINLDPDLYSKDTQGKTLAPEAAKGIGLADGVTARDQAVSSRNLLDTFNSIGSGGTISRTGTQLLAGDTFKVSGSFADSPWKLYFKEIAIAIGVLLAAGAAWWGWTKWLRHRKSLEPTVDEHVAGEKSKKGAHIKNTDIEIQAANFELSTNKPLAIKMALIGEALAIGATGILYLLTTATASSRTYSSGTEALLFPALLLVYLYVLVVLPLYVTVRHGRKTVFLWASLQILLAIISIIIMYFFTVSGSGSSSPGFVD